MERYTDDEKRLFLADIDDDAQMVRGLESYVALWYEHVRDVTSKQANMVEVWDEDERLEWQSDIYRDTLFLEFQMLQVLKDCIARKKRLLSRDCAVGLSHVELYEQRAQCDPSAID